MENDNFNAESMFRSDADIEALIKLAQEQEQKLEATDPKQKVDPIDNLEIEQENSILEEEISKEENIEQEEVKEAEEVEKAEEVEETKEETKEKAEEIKEEKQEEAKEEIENSEEKPKNEPKDELKDATEEKLKEEQEEDNSPIKKYIFYVSRDFVKTIDSLSIDERTAYINDAIQMKIDSTRTISHQDKMMKIIIQAVVVFLTVCITTPIAVMIMNKAIMSTFDNYKYSQQNFEKLYKQRFENDKAYMRSIQYNQQHKN